MENNNYVVTVLLATYNGEKFIKEQLESLREQTFDNFQVVIKDDNSSDNTVKIIKEFIALHKLNDWYLHVNEVNVGWRKNFRDLMSNCNTKYMFFCDQDDIWEPKKIELCVAEFEKNTQLKVLITDYEEIIEVNGKQEPPRKLKLNRSNRVLFTKKNWFNTRPGCCMAINNEIKNIIVKLIDQSCYLLPHDAAAYMIGEITGTLYLLPRKLIFWRKHVSSAIKKEDTSTRNTKKYYYIEKKYIDTRLSFSETLITFVKENYDEVSSFSCDLDSTMNIFTQIFKNRKKISEFFYNGNKLSFVFLLFIFDNKTEMKSFFLSKVLNK